MAETPGQTRAPRLQLSMLGIKRAYPNVITPYPYSELMEMGWDATSIDASKKLQDERAYAVRWTGERCDSYTQTLGLMEGCPNSCQLSLLYDMSTLEQWREESRYEN